MLMKPTYKFSIIIPFFNAELYLEDAVESVIQQKKINFCKDVQVILINDGSDDNSEKIVEKYLNKYPNNIKYIKQKNSGVSSARNIGMQYAEGEYLNFLDADDKLSDNSLNKVSMFFDKYEKYIDVVSIPLYFFEGKSESHILNYKFDKDEIIDIEEKFEYIQMSISGTFIKRTSIQGYKFREELKYGEDAYLITQIILKKRKYGIIRGAKYFYRYRTNMSSTMQNSWQNKQWFLDSVWILIPELKKLYEINNGLKYIQYIILYDLSWKISIGKRAKNTLSKKEWGVFLSEVQNILGVIDNDVILRYGRLNIRNMIIIYFIKYIRFQKITSLCTKIIWGA